METTGQVVTHVLKLSDRRALSVKCECKRDELRYDNKMPVTRADDLTSVDDLLRFDDVWMYYLPVEKPFLVIAPNDLDDEFFGFLRY